MRHGLFLAVVLGFLRLASSEVTVTRGGNGYEWSVSREVSAEWGGDSQGFVRSIVTQTVEEFRVDFPSAFEEARENLYNFREELFPPESRGWQLFLADYHASSDEAAAFSALLDQLNAFDYPTRRAAQRKLQDPQWLPMVLTCDVSGMPPEPRLRIDFMRSLLLQLPPDLIEALRNNPPYLQDCLEHAGPRLKFQIESRLNELNG
jgi:hypothetical protein